MFPPMVMQMIGVGEATGALDTMLAKIADFYEEEVDAAVAGLLTLLEPVMIAFLGVDRRRHRHRDVPADLRPDQQADLAPRPRCDALGRSAAAPALAHRHSCRRQHRAARLGAARPDHLAGSVAGQTRFFLLIGLTYALTLVHLATLRLRRPAPVARRCAARRRRAGHRRRSSPSPAASPATSRSLYVLPIIAASTLRGPARGARRSRC